MTIKPAITPEMLLEEEIIKTLSFYADRERWDHFQDDIRASVCDQNTGSDIGYDLGDRARLLLSRINESKER